GCGGARTRTAGRARGRAAVPAAGLPGVPGAVPAGTSRLPQPGHLRRSGPGCAAALNHRQPGRFWQQILIAHSAVSRHTGRPVPTTIGSAMHAFLRHSLIATTLAVAGLASGNADAGGRDELKAFTSGLK